EAEPQPTIETAATVPTGEESEQVNDPRRWAEPTPDEPPATPVHAVSDVHAEPVRRGHAVRSWPVLLLALPAFVAIWSGWVGLGGLTGFGIVHPLPGIADRLAINSAITLPFGVETYAAYALRAWLSPGVHPTARRFARWSA